MSLKTWWTHKSGKAKTIIVLCTVLILQIGLCFGTPQELSWSHALINLPKSQDPFEAVGWMAVEAMLCIVTILVTAILAIFWHPGLKAGKKNETSDDR